MAFYSAEVLQEGTQLPEHGPTISIGHLPCAHATLRKGSQSILIAAQQRAFTLPFRSPTFGSAKATHRGNGAISLERPWATGTCD